MEIGKKLALAMMVISLVLAMPIVHGTFSGEPKEIEEWLHKTSFTKEKVTKLRCYFHDTVSGKNPTSITVAQSSITDSSPTFFGRVHIIDDPLTLGPKPTSKLVGEAQGMYALSGQQSLSLLMAMNFAFTHGKYNGSSLTILGRNAVGTNRIREMPIVGGSGIFRLARGIATAVSTFLNTTTSDAIVEYNLLVFHY